MDPALELAFDAPGETWHRVSPKLASLRRSVLVGSLTLLTAAVLIPIVVFASPPIWVPLLVLAVVVIGGVWGWWLIARNVRSWGYTERAEDLLIRRGIVYRQLVVVPYGRMQFVDVNTSPLGRAFGIAEVRLHTAAATTDARIPGLVPEEAARLRDRLAALGESQSAGL